MSKTRFLKLNQYLHLQDASASTHPSLCPSRERSADEAMVAFKGRVKIRQYMPAKPIKRGMEVWALSDAQNGYCINFDVYSGRHGKGNTPVSPGEDVVVQLAGPYLNQQRHLYLIDLSPVLAL